MQNIKVITDDKDFAPILESASKITGSLKEFLIETGEGPAVCCLACIMLAAAESKASGLIPEWAFVEQCRNFYNGAVITKKETSH